MKRIRKIAPTSFARLMATAGTCVILAGMAQTAAAQTAPATTDKADDVQAIIVTGIQGSLQRAQAIKRNAPTVVEAVTLEDLGKFSDTNLADALQRVPGVQVDRNDSGIGGDRVTIRGLGPAYTQVTVDGRVIVTGGGEGIIDMRQFNFDVLPTDTIAGMEVYKTPTADLAEAGLAGLVDVKTLKPLDYHPKGSGQDLFGSFSASNAYDTLAKKSGQKYTAIVGAKLLDHTLGVFAGVATGKQPVANNELFSRFTYENLGFDDNSTGTANRTINHVLVPSRITTSVNTGDVKRLSFTSGFQWKPDSGFELNGNFLYSKENNDQDRSYGDIFVDGQGIFNGVSKPGGYNVVAGQLLGFNTANLEYPGAVPQVGFDAYPIIYNNDQSLATEGLNAKWTRDKWTLSIDGGYSATTFFQDLRVLAGAPLALENPVFAYNGVPTVPQFSGFNNYYHPAGSSTPVSFKHFNHNRTDVGSFKFDFLYHLNNDWNLKLGGRYQETHIDVTAGSLVNIAPDASVGYTSAVATQVTSTQVPTQLANYLGGLGSGLGLPLSHYSYNASLVPALVNAPNYNGASPDLGPAFTTTERTLAGYVQFDGHGTLFAIPYDANIGVRAVETRLTTGANSTVRTATSFGVIESSVNVPVTDRNQYWNFLPALNANFHLNPDLNMRLGIAEVMSRPEYNLTAPINTINFIDPKDPYYNATVPPLASAGNTHLKPLTAWNFDVTFEYYTANKGAIYTSFFYKDVKNFILTEITQNVIEPGQGGTLFTATAPVNARSGHAYGAEFGFTQPLSALWKGLDGLGVQANYNYTKAAITVDAAGYTLNGFPGTSKNNINGIVYFEKNGVGIRLAYAYRDDYFASLGDARTGQPTFTKGFGQLNLNGSFKLTKFAEVFWSVTNLTGENRRDYIAPGMFKSFVQLPSVISGGVRATF